MQEPLLKSFWLILIYFLFVSDWMSEGLDQSEEAVSNPGEINLNSSLTGIKKFKHFKVWVGIYDSSLQPRWMYKKLGWW